MAKVFFAPTELARVELICAEFDPATHGVTAGVLAAIEDGELRERLTSCLRREVRAELIMGLVSRAAEDVGVSQGSAEKSSGLAEQDWRGRYSPRSGLRRSTWAYNFGRGHDELLRLLCRLYDADVWSALLASGWPLLMRHYALLDLAHDAMFGTFEDDYRVMLEAANDA